MGDSLRSLWRLSTSQFVAADGPVRLEKRPQRAVATGHCDLLRLEVRECPQRKPLHKR